MKQFIPKVKRIKDFSFGKYFNVYKSPHTVFNFEKGIYEYVARHKKKTDDRVIWDSRRKGSYVFKLHGELKYSR